MCATGRASDVVVAAVEAEHEDGRQREPAEAASEANATAADIACGVVMTHPSCLVERVDSQVRPLASPGGGC